MGNIELFNGSILGSEVIASRYKPLMTKLQGKTQCFNSDERFFFRVRNDTASEDGFLV